MTAEMILAGARAMAEDFKNSFLYRDYLLNKKALKNDPLLYERVVAYKGIQSELEGKRLKSGSVGFEEEKRVAREFSELSLDPVAGAFLACEYELLELYREVLDTICEACEIELGD